MHPVPIEIHMGAVVPNARAATLYIFAPMMREDGKLLGLVSIGDLVKVKLDEAAQEAQALRAYIAS